MARTKSLTRIPPIIITYGDIRRGTALQPDITNCLTENQLQEFETAFKIGIIKQLEQNKLLTTAQSVQLVDMQKRRGWVTHGR